MLFKVILKLNYAFLSNNLSVNTTKSVKSSVLSLVGDVTERQHAHFHMIH